MVDFSREEISIIFNWAMNIEHKELSKKNPDMVKYEQAQAVLNRICAANAKMDRA